MDINTLISIIKKKISTNIICENLKVEDKTFLHKNHLGNDNNKFHIKLPTTSCTTSSVPLFLDQGCRSCGEHGSSFWLWDCSYESSLSSRPFSWRLFRRDQS